MGRDDGDKSGDKRAGHDRRSGRDRRSGFDTRSEEEKFLQARKRFSIHLSEASQRSSAVSEDAPADRKIRKKHTNKHSGRQQRTGHDRRCGLDTRSVEEKFLQGERRSGSGRRSGFELRYRSFKKARAFVRELGLISVGEWRDFYRSGMKPDDIPVAPHYVYANDGWAGWSDWLGANAVAAYLSQYRSFKKVRAFVQSLGLVSDSKWRAYCKSSKKPADIPTNPQSTYAEGGWIGSADWLGQRPKNRA